MGMLVAVRMRVSCFTFNLDFTLTAATSHTHSQSPLCTNLQTRRFSQLTSSSLMRISVPEVTCSW
jgi:hypothetical protein